MVVVAEANAKRGGRIAIEWPSDCDYWKLDYANDFLVKYHMVKAECQGCAFGLTDDEGVPILKPWTIAAAKVHRRRRVSTHASPFTKLGQPDEQFDRILESSYLAQKLTLDQ